MVQDLLPESEPEPGAPANAAKSEVNAGLDAAAPETAPNASLAKNDLDLHSSSASEPSEA